MDIERKSKKMKLEVLVAIGLDKRGRIRYQNAFQTRIRVNPAITDEKILRMGAKMSKLLKNKIKKIQTVETVELTVKEDHKETPEK